MKRARFSIAALMGIVAAVASILGALRYATVLWASAAFTLMVGLFCTAAIGSVYLRGKRRAFWVGYLVFAFVGFLMSDFGPGHADDTKVGFPPFMLMALLSYLEIGTNRSVKSFSFGITPWQPEPEHFFQVGESLGLIAFSLLGGFIARGIAASPRDDDFPASRGEAP